MGYQKLPGIFDAATDVGGKADQSDLLSLYETNWYNTQELRMNC